MLFRFSQSRCLRDVQESALGEDCQERMGESLPYVARVFAYVSSKALLQVAREGTLDAPPPGPLFCLRLDG